MAVKGASREKTKTKVQEPKKYKVIMHNDDFTTMEFVVDILTSIFHKNSQEAERLMLLVHNVGSAVVGTYPYDIAVSKVASAINRARSEGFPFRMSVEEA